MRAVEHVNSRKGTVLDKENPGVTLEIQLLIDPGVHKTLLSEKDWKPLWKKRADRFQIKLKMNKHEVQAWLGSNQVQ